MANEGGLITKIVVGVAALVISVIIAFIIVSTVADVETDTASAIGPYIVTAEGSNAAGTLASLNDTEYTLGQAGQTGFTRPVITAILNISNGGTVLVEVANASVTNAGVLTNGTTLSGGWDNVTLNYTYYRTQTSISTRDLRYNFTAGIDNVSEKIPTVLLIAAVVLILGILALLWFQYQRMNIGGSTSGGSL